VLGETVTPQDAGLPPVASPLSLTNEDGSRTLRVKVTAPDQSVVINLPEDWPSSTSVVPTPVPVRSACINAVKCERPAFAAPYAHRHHARHRRDVHDVTLGAGNQRLADASARARDEHPSVLELHGAGPSHGHCEQQATHRCAANDTVSTRGGLAARRSRHLPQR
jgi:hypothetical protein